ncbi:hypothetical protein QQX98_007484 [Neonectria punicea]|uniref:Uncharacterized protein n=1 Tax=Neonectria punicea TaxID=979145 RepID=A0ABR1GXQ9_9HYPO
MDVLRVLVEKKGASVDAHDFTHRMSAKFGNTPLHWLALSTAWWHTAQGIPYLVSRGADLEARNETGQTPLHLALRIGAGTNWDQTKQLAGKDAAKALVLLGADVNAIDKAGISCLGKAARDEDLVKLLIEHGARVSAMTILEVLRSPNFAALEMVLSVEGASDLAGSFSRSSKGLSATALTSNDPIHTHPLLLVSCEARYETSPYGQDLSERMNIMRALLAAGMSPYDTCIQHGFSQPEPSSLTGLPGLPHLLAREVWREDEIDTEQSTESFYSYIVERTVFHEALSRQQLYEPILEIADLDLEYRDSCGRTPFLAGCRTMSGFFHRETNHSLRPLLERGVDLVAVDSCGRNALHHLQGGVMAHEARRALLKDLENVIPSLVNEADGFGYYPLHYAVSFFNGGNPANPAMPDFAWIDHFLCHGADATVVDGRGNSLLHYIACGITGALSESDFPVEYTRGLFRRIVGLGVDVNGRNKAGQTPVHFLFAKPDERLPNERRGRYSEKALETALALLDELGVDWQARDNEGRTALHFVASRKGIIFKQIMARGVDPLMEDAEGRSSLDLAVAYDNRQVLAMFERENSTMNDMI